MAAAGIPPRYTPYCITHAVVSKLFSRTASLEQVTTFVRWARGSRVPLLFYNINTTDGEWIGARLIQEHPELGDANALHSGGASDASEADDEQSAETASTGDDEASTGADEHPSLPRLASREGHGLKSDLRVGPTEF
jgi:hypothetical protein